MLKPLAFVLMIGVAYAGPVPNLADPVNAAQINIVVSGVNTNAQLLGVHGKKLDSLITLLNGARADIEALKAENAKLKAQLAEAQAASDKQLLAIKATLEASKVAQGRALEAAAKDLDGKLTGVATDLVRKTLKLEHDDKQLKAGLDKLAEAQASAGGAGDKLRAELDGALKRFDGGVKQALTNIGGEVTKLKGDVSNLKQTQGQLGQGLAGAMKRLEALVKHTAEAGQEAAQFRAAVEKEGNKLVAQVKALAGQAKAVEQLNAKLVEVDVSAKQRDDKLNGEIQRVDGAGQKRADKLDALEVEFQKVKATQK